MIMRYQASSALTSSSEAAAPKREDVAALGVAHCQRMLDHGESTAVQKPIPGRCSAELEGRRAFQGRRARPATREPRTLAKPLRPSKQARREKQGEPTLGANERAGGSRAKTCVT